MTYPLADHFVHLDENTGRIRVLNQVAADMLALVHEGLGAEAIATSIARNYDVDSATAIGDVQHFLNALHSPDTALLEELEGYKPNTDFQPLRASDPVEHIQLNLPGYSLSVSSELSGLCDFLSAMFKLSAALVVPIHALTLDIFKEGDCYPIVSGGQTLDTGLTLADTAIKCLREINGLVARSQDWTIIFHASAVARNNAAVLMPALGGSGKSTLAAYLMHRGFAYLNDDAVPLLARSAKLQPIPVSLSIKEGSWPALTRYFPGLQGLRHFGPAERRIKYLPPEDVQVQLQPVPCRLLIIPEYSKSQREIEIVRLSEVEVFEKIIRSGCIIEQPVQPEILAALVSWLDGIPCYRIAYSSLEGIEILVSELLSDISESSLAAVKKDLANSDSRKSDPTAGHPERESRCGGENRPEP